MDIDSWPMPHTFGVGIEEKNGGKSKVVVASKHYRRVRTILLRSKKKQQVEGRRYMVLDFPFGGLERVPVIFAQNLKSFSSC